jgi:hypothetical protein
MDMKQKKLRQKNNNLRQSMQLDLWRKSAVAIGAKETDENALYELIAEKVFHL